MGMPPGNDNTDGGLLQEIRHKAIQLLASREHSRLQLFRKLTSRDFSPEDVNPILDQLAQEGLQSDARFAESFVRSKADRGQGPIRIAAELREHGINDAMVADYLDATDSAWYELARKVREKRFGADLPEDYATRSKQARFLQYRGFNAEQVRVALGQEWDGY